MATTTIPGKYVKLGIVISYWNGPSCVDKCLHSLHNFWFDSPEWFYVDLILVDGVYKHFGGHKYPVRSNKKTYQIISKHKESMMAESPPERLTITHYRPNHDAKPLPEKQKRQLGFDLATESECDFVLSLDTDEYIDNAERHGARCWPNFAYELMWMKYKFMANLDAAIIGVKSIEVVQRISSRSNFRPKLFYRPENIYYTANHYTFNVSGPKCNIHSPIAVYHDPRCKDQRMFEDMEYYKRKLPWIE